jgi:C-terminal processing protease CtpA/Prc
MTASPGIGLLRQVKAGFSYLPKPMKATQRRTIKMIAMVALLLIAVFAGVLLREYMMLKKIQASLRQMPAEAQKETHREKAAETLPEARLVLAVSRSADGSLVRARANFSLFKKRVEAQPELLHKWGRVVWSITEDLPALCVRSLADDSPFRLLGVKSGDCITHIDGESINQPMRNMAIWLTLPARSRLKIDTLRDGKRISYELVRQ